MSTKPYDALQHCLDAMRAGADIESCLHRYPDFEDFLRPVLEAAAVLEDVRAEGVPPQALARSRARLLRRASQLRSVSARSRTPLARARFALASLAVILAFFLGGQRLWTASAQSLPGDLLYAVKLAGEDLSLRLEKNPAAREQLTSDFEKRRADEVRQLLERQRVTQVRLEGQVTEISLQRWVVAGVPVVVSAQTLVDRGVGLGTTVLVEGETQPEGWLLAARIRLLGFMLIGRVDSISTTTWVVSGMSLQITAETAVDPTVRTGDEVEVFVRVIAGGGNMALTIRLRSPATPTASPPLPSETPAPPTPTPAPQGGEIEFSGVVSAIGPDTWTVDGRMLWVDASTEIKGSPAIGDTVKVHAIVAADGQLRAREIERESGEKETPEDGDGDEDDDDGSGGSGGSHGSSPTPDEDEGEEEEEDD